MTLADDLAALEHPAPRVLTLDIETSPNVVYAWGLYGQDSDLEQPVQHWNERAEAAGQRFNYNELCALTVGMVLRRVTGGSFAAFAEQALWQPMGAEGDASWQCDSRGREFNCVGLAARLSDWMRIGQLFARGGQVDGRQIISSSWMRELCSWRQDEQYLRRGRLPHAAGYKAFIWHNRDDGSQPYLDGHHGQHVFTDMTSGTVLVHTAVDTTPEMLVPPTGIGPFFAMYPSITTCFSAFGPSLKSPPA